VSGTQPSLSHTNAARLNKLSLPSLRVLHANVVLLILALSICASARAQVSLSTVATDQSVEGLSNHFGVPFGGTVDQNGDYAFLGDAATAAFYRHAGTPAAVRILQIGDPVPGITGSRIVAFLNGGGINSSGHVVFAVRLATASGVPGGALLTYDGTSVQLVVSSSDIAPGTGGKTYGLAITPVGINDNGVIAFITNLLPIPGIGVAQRTLFMVPSGGGTAVRVLGAGDAAPGTGTISSLQNPSGFNPVNALGEVLVPCVVQQSVGGRHPGFFVGSVAGGVANVQRVVVGGDAAPPPTSGTFSNPISAFLSDNGSVAFGAATNTTFIPATWLWTAPSTITRFAATGDPVSSNLAGGGFWPVPSPRPLTPLGIFSSAPVSQAGPLAMRSFAIMP